MGKPLFKSISLLLLVAQSAAAQFIDTSPDRVKTPLACSWKRIGTLKPRGTTQIASSPITVGCETLDRDFANFNAYKAYLPSLGVKKIRLQAGWAKCEKQRGVYDWGWLDQVIDYAAANGLEPWLETSYGNPLYEGGGKSGLLNSLMTSPEGYAAWDRWVEALVNRYKGRVKEWEIWNEPDHPMQNNAPETIADLNIRTAEIIKRLQPDARIAGLAMASCEDTVYLGHFLKVLSDRKKLDLLTWISYHSYAMRPEDVYPGVAALQRVLGKYSKTIKLRQGENGAPSGYIPSFALDKYYWTEYTQAKYNLRRMLGDLGRGIETEVFTIIDLRYAGNPPVLNMKGLIQSDDTKAAIRPKVAYYAVQNVASFFDNTLQPLQNAAYTPSAGDTLSVFGHQHRDTKKQLFTVWVNGGIPTNRFDLKPVDIEVKTGNFDKPVWVDVMTGQVHEIPAKQWTKTGNTYRFTGIPVYDSPILIADQSLLSLQLTQ
jgi:hypothetical protein